MKRIFPGTKWQNLLGVLGAVSGLFVGYSAILLAPRTAISRTAILSVAGTFSVYPEVITFGLVFIGVPVSILFHMQLGYFIGTRVDRNRLSGRQPEKS